MVSENSFLLLMSILALISAVLLLIRNKKQKRKRLIFIEKKKQAFNKRVNVSFSKGLKVYEFPESSVIPSFRCVALNEKNARRKYSNFIKEVNAAINKGVNSVWFTDIDNKRKLKTIKTV